MSLLTCANHKYFIEYEITKNILSFFIAGKSYDERVDIFSFGIMLCEVSYPSAALDILSS